MVCKKLQEFDWDFFFFLAKGPFQSKHTYKHGITHLRLLFAALARIFSLPLSSISYCGLLLSPVIDRIEIIIQQNITPSLRKNQYRQVEGKLDRGDQRFPIEGFFFFFLNLYFKIAYGW